MSASPVLAQGTGDSSEFSLTASEQVASLADLGRASLVRVIRGEEVPGQATPNRRVGTGVSMGDGLFLTCAGVVGPARDVLIVSADGDTLVAHVKGHDRRSNLAVLEAPGFAMPALPIDQGALILPGEMVVAVGLGSPDTPTATFGTVILSKGIGLGYSEIEMIQTTSPVFRGYTGGVLLNRRGQLLGILSGVVALQEDQVFIPEGTDLVAGILHRGHMTTITPSATTVAIPARQAMQMAEDIAEHGFVPRGYFGLQVEMTRSGGLSDSGPSRGILVHQVVDGGPASRAGLLPGDFILEFGGVRVHNPEDLSFLVSSRVPGSSVLVRFIRRGSRGATTVVLEQAPPVDWEPDWDAALAGQETVNPSEPTKVR
ncbi:MAG: PDZ domain-containing protein [Candidatus Eisenbacteria bacterium]|uniref:PDZ domain-containing protein n=1 Tax=Eiseniibacteriota bacterium TaxID=2212470 RepID=A0A7Y2H1R3_UNCEI|nr:PDZ domain-containing protein [Candidatus Eisenbacteria bacterium]